MQVRLLLPDHSQPSHDYPDSFYNIAIDLESLCLLNGRELHPGQMLFSWAEGGYPRFFFPFSFRRHLRKSSGVREFSIADMYVKDA
jgi:hypothetical protein